MPPRPRRPRPGHRPHRCRRPRRQHAAAHSNAHLPHPRPSQTGRILYDCPTWGHAHYVLADQYDVPLDNLYAWNNLLPNSLLSSRADTDHRLYRAARRLDAAGRLPRCARPARWHHRSCGWQRRHSACSIASTYDSNAGRAVRDQRPGRRMRCCCWGRKLWLVPGLGQPRLAAPLKIQKWGCVVEVTVIVSPTSLSTAVFTNTPAATNTVIVPPTAVPTQAVAVVKKMQ